MRAASTLAASRDNSTMLAPCSAKICAIASPIPIEAPVTTTTFSASSISGFYSGAEAKSRDGAGDGVQSKPLLGLDHQHWRPVTSLLSLFPLDLVLLPGCPLPLHIFEPRYKEMIAECRAQDSSFGIVRIVEKGFADIGCTAEIVSIVKEYPHARLDIISDAPKLFEPLRVNQNLSV